MKGVRRGWLVNEDLKLDNMNIMSKTGNLKIRILDYGFSETKWFDIERFVDEYIDLSYLE